MEKIESKKTVRLPKEREENDNESEEDIVIKVEEQTPKRGRFNNRLEFMLSCISMAVGLGNIWRFPYLCFRNGGGAFLIPFLVTMCFIGLPLFFLELALGQFASLGAIGVWNISPIFKGIGYGMAIISAIVSVYYNVIVAQCLYYFGVSFTSQLPWSNCNNSWNNKTLCYESLENLTTISGKLSPSEEYYDNFVLNKSDSISNMGLPQWRLVICLLVAWILVVIILIKGVEIFGKVSYFTALFPYVILTILLIRGLLLPGSLQGIMYYIKPDFSLLKDPKVWVEAATQVFFSLGVCNGNLITMSSYNEFKNDCLRDAIIFAVIDCATSVYAGFVIFTNMGFMSHIMNVSMSQVVAGGPGLAFKVYPEALTKLPLSPLWSILFFLMMISLGFGSQVAMVETVLSSFQDELRRIKLMTSKNRILIYRLVVCFLLFLIGIPMTCRGGVYLVDLFDLSISGYPMLILALIELIVISYVYGVERFMEDVFLMINRRPNIYWKVCWMAISPLFILLMIISLIVFSYNQPQPFPPGYMALLHILTCSPLAALFIVFMIYYCKNGGWMLLTEIKKPLHNWGPADTQNKETFFASLNEIPKDTMGSTKFFQSKESIAEKFLKRAAKSTDPENKIELLASDYYKTQSESLKD